MASETRSGRKNKHTECNKSKNKQSDKGSISSGSGKTDSLRKSVRETKQAASSPSSTRKSERLEKQSPSPPAVKKKSGVIEKQNTPSPLRRSDRGKKDIPSSLSRSSYVGRGPDSSSVKKKEPKEKSVKELIMDFESVSTGRENGATSVGLKRS